MDVFGIVQQAHEHVLVLEKLYAKNMSEHEYICWCAELLIIFIHEAHYSIFFVIVILTLRKIWIYKQVQIAYK